MNNQSDQPTANAELAAEIERLKDELDRCADDNVALANLRDQATEKERQRWVRICDKYRVNPHWRTIPAVELIKRCGMEE